MPFESITRMATAAEKPEKSQAELRTVLEQKLASLKPVMEKGIKAYEQALKEGVFEDQDGESKGTGEKRKETMQEKLGILLDRAEKMKVRLESKETWPQASEDLSTTYTRPDGRKEIITLNLEAKLADFLSFYQKTNIDLPTDFEDTIRDLWEQHQTDIEQAIEQNGFDNMLLIPGNILLPELKDKMTMGSGYYTGSNFDGGGGFAGAVSPHIDKPRIILYHKKTLPEVKSETGLDVHLNITAGDALKLFGQNPDKHMTLPDFIIMERKIFEDSGTHISDWNKKSGQWLNTKSGARLVGSGWDPGNRKQSVFADDLEHQNGNLGVRPSRCFF